MVQVVIYKAKDGKVFNNKQECLKYEKENFPEEIKVKYNPYLEFFYKIHYIKAICRLIKKYIKIHFDDKIKVYKLGKDHKCLEEMYINWRNCKNIEIFGINNSMPYDSTYDSNHIILNLKLIITYIDYETQKECRVINDEVVIYAVPFMDKTGVCGFKDAVYRL